MSFYETLLWGGLLRTHKAREGLSNLHSIRRPRSWRAEPGVNDSNPALR